MTKPIRLSRYPGIRSFERAEQALFFGRDREITALFEAVKVKPLTVLFAKSGIGKTSLLNAGLFPVLEQNGFLPISVRLQDTSLSPVETLKKVLQPYLNAEKLARFGRSPHSLWEYVRSCDFKLQTSNFKLQTPTLVFDQFEELFTHHRTQRDELTAALADLLNERLPDAIRQRLREYPREQRTDELLDWYEPLKIKVVFAIRADRMSDLDELKYHIPTVLHDRFHLKPLSHENARAAIEQPAALEPSVAQFSSPPFSYAPEAIQEILESLGNEQGEIESFQLQLLCGFLEHKITQRGQVITSADFGGPEGINSILNDYYERSLAVLDPAEQITARRFIEEGLIVSGRRTGVPEGTEQTRFGVNPDLLSKLLNSRLLRAETIHLGKIYELSHDTLVEPVLRSYERRRQEEERQEAARQLAEERAQLAELSHKRARARMLAIAGFVLFGLAMVGGVLAFLNGKKAEKALGQAEIATLANKAWSVYREDHTMAFRLAQAALNIDTTNEEALQTLRNIVNDPTTAFYKTVFAGHHFEVRALAFSPDGKTLATGSFDSDIRTWDLNGRVHYVIPGSKSGGSQGHVESVNALIFSASGQVIYSGGDDGQIKGWTASTGDSLLSWAAHNGPISELDLAPHGGWLLSASLDGTAKLWEISSGKCLRTFEGHDKAVRSARFSPDQQRILTGGLDGSARLWTLDGRCLRTIQLPGGAKVNSARFSPDGRMILLGCSDNTAKLFDLEGRQINSLSSHTAEVTKAIFSPDGRYILTTSNDRSAKLWTRDGEERLRLIGHTERVAMAAFSPDGRSVVTSGWDFTAKLWNIEFNLNNKASRHLDYVSKVQVAPDGLAIFTCSRDNTLKKWDLEGDLLADMQGHTDVVNNLQLSPDGALLLSASDDRTVRLWSAADSKCLHTWLEFKSKVKQAVFAPDGRRFVALESNGTVSVWDVGGILHRWKIDAPSAELGLALSPDGQRVFVGGADGLIHIRTLSGQPIDTLENDGVLIWGIALSPDGNTLLTAAQEYAVRAWDWKAHTFEKYFGHLNENYQVAWSADGSCFVSASWDWTAKIWDKTGKTLLTLKHPDGVYGACFSPDGRKVITACRDKIVRVWDASTGQMINTIGSRLSVSSFLRSTEIAGLESIAFDWERYGISSALATKIYNNDPTALCRQAQQLAVKGAAAMGNYDEGLRYLQEAEQALLLAKRLGQASASRLPYDSLVAEVYSTRANLLLMHRQFGEALQAARDGMRYQPLDFLKIYEVNCLLLDGQYDAALQKGRAIRGQPVTQISFYPDMSFWEAIGGELGFYREQYGIVCPEEGRFVAALKAE